MSAEAVARDSDDRSLAALVLAGDEQAFRLLYRRHTPRLFCLVQRLLASEADAEDAVQETWVRATDRLAGFRWEASFGSWLTAIGLNIARETLRKRGRRREEEWVPDMELPAPPRLERVEAMDLERALRALPSGYRTVLVLHDVEGYRHEEIAERLGIAAGTSKSQLFHARRAMRVLLGERREAADD